MSDSDCSEDDDCIRRTDDAIRAEYDWSEVAPSTAVVETVAVVADEPPTELRPLQETVDSDALDTLVASDGIDSPDGDVSVSFTLAGQDVLVESDGTVAVWPETADDRPE